MAGRPTPQAVEAERALLGGLMQDPRLVAEIQEHLRPEDFYRPEHEALFRLLGEMQSRGESLDMVTVPERIARDGKQDRYGGVAYVVELPDQVPPSRNLPHYARVIKDKSLLRDLIKAADQLSDKAYTQPDDVMLLLEGATNDISSIGRGA